jgi:hypothetical protein
MSDTDYEQRMKTGRNEPCPCGSGKKYKKCHSAADQTARSEALKAIEAEAAERAAKAAADEDDEEGAGSAKSKQTERQKKSAAGSKSATGGKPNNIRRRGFV